MQAPPHEPWDSWRGTGHRTRLTVEIFPHQERREALVDPLNFGSIGGPPTMTRLNPVQLDVP